MLQMWRFSASSRQRVSLRLMRGPRIRRKTLRFFGTWNCQFRSLECDPVIRLTRAGPRTSMVLPKDAAKARAFGRDGAPAPVWRRVFLASIAFPKNDPKGAGLVRRGHVSRLSVRKIYLFDATSRRRKFSWNFRDRPFWRSPGNFA